jgi:uncharacterized protein with von Willebrand factor type A (vWA) domain
MPAATLERERVNKLAQAARNDATVRPYRSFHNLSVEIFCMMEAPSKEALRSRSLDAASRGPIDYILATAGDAALERSAVQCGQRVALISIAEMQ